MELRHMTTYVSHHFLEVKETKFASIREE